MKCNYPLPIFQGGMYVFQIFDYYAGSRIIILVAFLECATVAWLYGINRFYDNMEMMLGRRIDPYMKISWTFTSPIFCLVRKCIKTLNITETQILPHSLLFVE